MNDWVTSPAFTMLYTRAPNQQDVEFDEYLETFCAELREALADDVEVVCLGSDKLNLDSPRAIHLALIASEGVTNALKHAFPEGRGGTISVECPVKNGQGVLTVQDNGIGMADETGEHTMGLKLLRTLTKGLGRKLRIDSPKGTRLQVKFSV